MAELRTFFSDEDAKQLFREAGLTVEIQDVPVSFPVYHNKIRQETIPCWVVISPKTNKPVLLRKAFEKFLQKRAKNLFLEGSNKLDIYNLFDEEI